MDEEAGTREAGGQGRVSSRVESSRVREREREVDERRTAGEARIDCRIGGCVS